ncbi:hypothetical protein SRS16CHR_00577 [Variovorax sp. SRS16]|uniref:DUF1840 domain-containing protein n=1 Tax=Variovorax sp. SRS16 TaxID=282217 RepID=UPI0013163D86|nr:DUF1840 domain-containing protein [Variovorax sp. SRS16]VTU13411.1 hypothetical protein SRS16CHR_00577 [Variovorax sp. SRS16]
MLYRFKSQATADVVMLEANARQLLEIIGKSSAPKGIIMVDQMSAAVSALEAAIKDDAVQNRHNHDAFAVENHASEAELQHVGLHQRAAPLIDMLKRSQAESKDIVWGV